MPGPADLVGTSICLGAHGHFSWVTVHVCLCTNAMRFFGHFTPGEHVIIWFNSNTVVDSEPQETSSVFNCRVVTDASILYIKLLILGGMGQNFISCSVIRNME